MILLDVPAEWAIETFPDESSIFGVIISFWRVQHRFEVLIRREGGAVIGDGVLNSLKILFDDEEKAALFKLKYF